jgi:hypothetical protein
MTDTERNELREWSAGVMGWERVYAEGLPMWKFPNGRWDSVKWTPDTDYNQLFNLFIPRMRELGWYLQLNNYSDDDEGYQARFLNYEIPKFAEGIKSLKVEKAEEEKLKRSLAAAFTLWKTSTNPALAILLAAKATGVK